MELEIALTKKGNTTQAEMVRNILPEGVECIFIRQAEQLGLGHAILCAERAVGNEPFAVLLADDFLISTGEGITSDLVQCFNQTEKTQLSAIEVNGPEISKYGVLELCNDDETVCGLIEKPKFKDATSNLASIGRYILSPDIFDVLRNLPCGSDNEMQLADAINLQAKEKNVEYKIFHGKRFDCGSVSGYIDAIIYVANRSGLT